MLAPRMLAVERRGRMRRGGRVRKRTVLSLLTAAGLGLGALAAQAQTYPSRPIKVVVPFAAGGPLDLVARTLSDKLSARLKQPFVIENRVGAGGNLGTEVVARAPPDGYTLLMVLATTLTANPALYRKLPFDPDKDLRPISLLTNSSQMMVVHPSVPVSSLAEFVALAKKEPLTYAHAGPGSGGHLTMEYFRTMAGFETVQVPYRGNAPLVIDLVAGQVKAGFVATAGVIGHVRAGRLKGLAISSAKRSPLAPDVPTTAEAGYPDFKVDTYFAMLGPAGLPEPVADLLERETLQALQLPDLQEKLRAQDIEVVGTTGAEARARLRADTELWGRITKAANMRVD
jgi:tripartite-type tricarboxylate transporter receptor subunit TctC